MFVLVFLERLSLCIPGCPETRSGDKLVIASLKPAWLYKAWSQDAKKRGNQKKLGIRSTCAVCCYLTLNSNPAPVAQIEVIIPKPDLTPEQKQLPLLLDLEDCRDYPEAPWRKHRWRWACEALQERREELGRVGLSSVPRVILVQV